MPHRSLPLTVEDIMSSPVITINENASLEAAARIMLDRRIGCLPVINADRKMIGVVTDGSFFPSKRYVPFSRERLTWLMGAWVGRLDDIEETIQRLRKQPVTDGMSQREPVSKSTPLGDAAQLMLDMEVQHVVVMDGDELVGVVSRHDMAKVFLWKQQA